jgi:hypothetical protein
LRAISFVDSQATCGVGRRLRPARQKIAGVRESAAQKLRVFDEKRSKMTHFGLKMRQKARFAVTDK